MTDKLCILQGSCSKSRCGIALVSGTRTLIAMFGAVLVHAATSMRCIITNRVAMATAGPGIGDSESCAAFADCVYCLMAESGLSCPSCCVALLTCDCVATCRQMQNETQCTWDLTQHGGTSGLESSAVSCAYAAVQVFHFSESKDKEDNIVQDGQLPAGTLQSQASDKKSS